MALIDGWRPPPEIVKVSRSDQEGAAFETLTEKVVTVFARNNARVGVTGSLVAFDG